MLEVVVGLDWSECVEFESDFFGCLGSGGRFLLVYGMEVGEFIGVGFSLSRESEVEVLDIRVF